MCSSFLFPGDNSFARAASTPLFICTDVTKVHPRSDFGFTKTRRLSKYSAMCVPLRQGLPPTCLTTYVRTYVCSRMRSRMRSTESVDVSIAHGSPGVAVIPVRSRAFYRALMCIIVHSTSWRSAPRVFEYIVHRGVVLPVCSSAIPSDSYRFLQIPSDSFRFL